MNKTRYRQCPCCQKPGDEDYFKRGVCGNCNELIDNYSKLAERMKNDELVISRRAITARNTNQRFYDRIKKAKLGEYDADSSN